MAARLVLVSVREGHWHRAELELGKLRELGPNAKGRLGGREVHLVKHISDLLKQARHWPAIPSSNNWPTFAATAQRTNASEMTEALGQYELLWSQPIANQQLASFPVVINGLVVYQDDASVRGLNLSDGSAAFTAKGSAFHSPKVAVGAIGHSRYSLTATDRFVYGITSAVLGTQRRIGRSSGQSTLWSLDLNRDGALALHLSTNNPKHSFAGSPVVVGTNLIVPIRAVDQTARVGLTAYDKITGQQQWIQWLCQAKHSSDWLDR